MQFKTHFNSTFHVSLDNLEFVASIHSDLKLRLSFVFDYKFPKSCKTNATIQIKIDQATFKTSVVFVTRNVIVERD